ncbi:MAG: MlaD family protein [Terriglobia bacterium]
MARKRILVGVFIVCGIVLFCVGLFIIGNQEELFHRHFTVYTTFSRIATLQTGDKVRVAGMAAGELTGIQIPKTAAAPFRIELKIARKFRPLVREDSVATIATEGMVGAEYINIGRGSSGSPECPPGCTLRSQEPVEMSDLMREAGSLMKTSQASIVDLRKHADLAIQNIGNTAGHADGLIQATRGDVKKITSNAGDILASVRQGHGVAGKLLMNRTAGSNVSATIANANETSANLAEASRKANQLISQVQERKLLEHVQLTLENTQRMTGQLNRALTAFLAAKGKGQGTVIQLKQAVAGADQTMSNLADDTEAIKTNFFLRGFFKRRGFYNLSDLTPRKYLASSFLKHPHLRSCVAAAGLFNSGPGDSLEISSAGRVRLDQAMSSLVPHLPNNPIMVEGYSTGSSPAQAYLSSRQRALKTRQYLEAHFHIRPKWIGVMPLGEHPQLGTGQPDWNGVCAVLAISKP